ncbi:S-adenosyl-L-methionine-dependent methyltransferase [Morchella snyderi]|nr:S-adenosyl-L-methionine-dependent methyltransferase [Morchella snyderi]
MASASTDPVVQDMAEINRKYFNEQAENYNSHTSHQKVTQIIADEVLKRKEWSGVAWDEDNTRLLDYACGTGMFSKILAPYTKQLIGMDLSEGMVDLFNKSVHDQGIPSEEMRAIVANLCVDKPDPVLSDPDYHDFDAVISTFALHHVSDAPLAINRLVERLKKETGVLLIIDFRTHDPVFPHGTHSHNQHQQYSDQHEHHKHESHPGNQRQGLEESEKNENTVKLLSGHHTVTHSGFSEENIKRWYREAGLVDIDIVDVGPGEGVTITVKDPKTEEVIKMQKNVFMAKGRRA